MDAQLRGTTAGGAKDSNLRAACLSVLAFAGLTVLWLFASLLLMRRLTGNLTAPLDTPLLLTTGWMLFASAVGLRACWKQPATLGPWRRLLVFFAVAIVPIILSAVALTLPGSPTAGIGLLWLLVGGSAAWSVYTDRFQRAGSRIDRPSIPASPESKVIEPVEISPLESGSDSLSADLIQQFTRVRDADGSERVKGLARAEFQAGQRQASLHIAFCPPFEKKPELEAEQVEGPASRLKIGQLQPFGARLDLRFTQPESEPQSVVVQFAAHGNLAEEEP